MITDEEALIMAKNERSTASYLSECAKSAGIRKINSVKSEWLSRLIYLAEQALKGKSNE